MKRSGKYLLLGLLGGLTLTPTLKATVDDTPKPGASADSSGEPYEAIWLRNVFDLRPPAPPPPVDPTPVTPPPNVHLTGITTIFGKKQALFLVQDQPQPGKPPEKERSYMMSEGDRRDKLEVLEIDPKTRKVKIKVDDSVSTITFETNRPSGGAPPMGNPGQFQPPPGLTAPGFVPRPPQQQGLSPGFQRDVRTQNATQPNYGNNNYAPQPSAGGGINFGGQQASIQNAAVQNPAQNAEQNLTPEQATALFLLNQHAHAAEEAAGNYPPAPPPIAAMLGQASGTSGSSTTDASSGPPVPTTPSNPYTKTRVTGNFKGAPPPLP